MGDPDRNPLRKQLSKSSLEKSLQMISPPQQAPVTIYPGPSAGIANLSKTDLEIAQRLENLRKSQNEELPTEEEMACRLAHLKGLPTNHYTMPTLAGAHQRPDPRTQGQQSDDLLSQVVEEVSLEARLPNPEDELEARLARLRGEAGGARPAQQPAPAGAVALPPQASNVSQAKMDAKLGEDLEDMSMDEVEALMKAASAEAEAGAEQSLKDMRADPEVAGAVAQAAIRRKEKKNKKKKKEGEMSEEERRSKSFDSDLEIEGGKAIDAVTEQEEVQRIIDMYTKRAELKKEKKKRKREEAAAAAAQGGAAAAAVVVEESDSDIEISSASDLTSDSERDSLTDELSE